MTDDFIDSANHMVGHFVNCNGSCFNVGGRHHLTDFDIADCIDAGAHTIAGPQIKNALFVVFELNVLLHNTIAAYADST
ncbi:MAG: hypothetical protein QG625_2118 [Cyanobacteriota bacterium erpe_2018_sw_39hr_WHONDRS-SW48-000098_B_bin.30]|nr:hypothetical protein [Cyanobacteriota bacterium erpe_2018_sw_39hr_WHONDRS-SW48-000098_B_bin.30]